MIGAISSRQIRIPKTIHYCWFGSQPMTDLMKRCIESWAVKLPDYKIVFWGDQSVVPSSNYAQTAMLEQNWGNLGNLFRYSVLYRYGGIYLDVDVEILQSLDTLLDDGCFMGCQSQGPLHWMVNSAVMGAVAGHWFVGHLLKCLIQNHSGRENPSISGVNLPSTELVKCGLGSYSTRIQHVDDIKIYPTHSFHPIPFNKKHSSFEDRSQVRDETYTIHHWENSWIRETTPPVGRANRRTLCSRAVQRIARVVDGRWRRRAFVSRAKETMYDSLCNDFSPPVSGGDFHRYVMNDGGEI